MDLIPKERNFLQEFFQYTDLLCRLARLVQKFDQNQKFFISAVLGLFFVITAHWFFYPPGVIFIIFK
jgi:hypothetical protein